MSRNDGQIAPGRFITAAESTAYSLVVAHPTLRFELFGPDWACVDRGRARVSSTCLRDRVGVHHRDAFFCPVARAALAAFSPAAVVVFISPQPHGTSN